MADIVDPTAIRFVNERVRPAADRLARAYYDAVSVIDEWFAEGLNTTITNVGTDEVKDGGVTDGRGAIFGSDVHNLITRLTELRDDYQATSNAKLNTVLKPAVNTKP